MKQYDCIVVGSGITGLTLARILAQHGKKILLLEKAAILGGTAARFRVGGIPFDVGFHFTGGFNHDQNGVLDVMLALLGVKDQIHPIYFPRDASHTMIFSSLGAQYTVPCGVERVREKMKADFPKHKDGLDRYFHHFMNVVNATPTLHVSGFDDMPMHVDEDHVTLQTVLDQCISDPMIQTILGGLCMCYGTRPNQVSFATHARVSWGLQETLARVEGGGDAFVDSLVDALKNDRVEIRTRTSIAEFADIKDRKVNRFVLTDGTQVSAKECILTLHPQAILAMLPKEHLSKAFQTRVNDFEPSNAFFTLYGKLDRPITGPATLASILPDVDLNKMLTCTGPEPVDGPAMVLRSMEQGNSGPVHTITALEVAFAESTNQWAQSHLKRRPDEYYQYKDQRTASLLKRMHEHIPISRDMQLIDSASNLTYRDYLFSPDGSAYGIRQKMGQFNVTGRLPLTNLYAAGQNALLPGIVGAMTSAFFTCRSILGSEVFRNYLGGKPCHSNAS